MRSEIQRLLTVATAEVGVQEQPKGSNRGRRVEEYLSATGLDGGFPWCAALVAWCGKQVGNWPLPLTADCDVLLSTAKRRDILHDAPQVGDIFLVLASASDAIHTGIVARVNGDGTITSIEGNSNETGAREGYEVTWNPRRSIVRAGRLPLVFVRWIDLLPDAEKPWTVRLAGETDPFATADVIGGQTYLPARTLLAKVLGGMDATANRLLYDKEDNALQWDGQHLSAPVVLRQGTAWAAVRPLLQALHIGVAANPADHTIVVGYGGGLI